MQTSLKTAVTSYLQAGNHAKGTKAEYQTMLNKWQQWGNGIPLENWAARKSGSFWTGCILGRSLKMA
jgi:hypothetical protein